MSQPSFKHPLSAFVFDAYGTLLDVARAVSANAPLVGPDSARLVELWRQKQLEYSWVHALMDEYVPFWLLTERALDFAMARLPSVPTLARPALLSSYRTLAAYDDAAHTLAALRAEGKRTAVLSNGNPEMLDSAFSAASLTPLLESIISVEAARTFKPAANVYQLVLDTLAVERASVCFVSSNRWDIAGAAQFGFFTVWVNRLGLPDEYPGQPPNCVIASLSELLDK